MTLTRAKVFVLFGNILFAALTPILASSSDFASRNVEAKIMKDGGSLRFEVMNTSSTMVRINPPLFNRPDVLGHWLFLYDPKTKNLQTAWSTSFGTKERRQGSPILDELKPGQRSVNAFALNDILGYFMIVPDCFHVVYIVRLKQGDNIVSSAPSNTIYMCKPE